MKYSPTDIARQWSFVREHNGPNNGVFVRAIQQVGTAGGIGNESWCADFVSLILQIAFQGVDVPFPRSSAANDFYARALLLGWTRQEACQDDLFVTVNAQNHAHHIGIVTSASEDVPQQVVAIAGNTNDGGSDNGDGVYEKPLHHAPTDHIIFIHYPRG